MKTDLEPELRRAFAAFERQAPPVATPEWAPTTYTATLTPRADFEHRGRARPMMLAGASAGAALVVGVVLVLARQPQQPSGSAPVFQPAGIEFPITAIPPLVPAASIVKAGSVRSVSIPGHPDLTQYINVEYFNGHVRQFRCIEGTHDGAGCGPEWTWTTPSISETSTVDNRNGTSDLWIWDNVPAAAAFVSWTDGELSWWQRPVDGITAFPLQAGYQTAHIAATAYDVNGNELLRVGAGNASPVPVAHDPDDGAVAVIDDSAAQQLQTLTESSMRQCLATNGADAWSQCVTSSDDIVTARFVQLGGTYDSGPHG